VVGKIALKMVEPITTGGGRVTTHGALARADTGEKVRFPVRVEESLNPFYL
jgi:hypothetical protein